jgi:signal transduction histidine kinase
VTNIEQLWLATLQEVASRAAHEVRDALNGVSLNLEVVRSRISRPDTRADSLGPFVSAAVQQLEILGSRAEALVYLSRTPKNGRSDTALVLRHLATLLVPAAKADQIALSVSGHDRPAETAVQELAVRTALASGLLALIKEGGGECRLEGQPDAVVRFSHESAEVGLDKDVLAVLAKQGVRTKNTDSGLTLTFPV